MLRDAPDWEDNPNLSISTFSELPSKNFGVNQHMVINEEFKEALRQILWKFRAPIRYAFAYGSGVFAQTSVPGNEPGHPSPPQAIRNVQQGKGKMIDFIFGVSHSQHWHSLNLQEHRDHYSALGSLGSYAVSQVQDNWGAGVYFNPFVTVNGTLIKYGVVNIDTLCKDLSQWDTMYLAGRLQKPVKILRDHPSVRLANQVNLISALRLALLLLPQEFTEYQLYTTIAGLSYMGDPRMTVSAEDPGKVNNIVSGQMDYFRRLYAPLIENLPNCDFNDPRCTESDWIDDPEANVKLNQDMDPVKRGNMVRRLPKSFRERLYFQFQGRYQIPRAEFLKMMKRTNDEDPERIHRRQGGPFEQRIAADESLKQELQEAVTKTIRWPATMQTVKSALTAGAGRAWTYVREKRKKHADSTKKKSSEPGPKKPTTQSLKSSDSPEPKKG
ncbi:mitochondrial matrix Mmp37 [Talaromyces proteolyticus]|uniref:Phosphatidate cytidylyltransferase, mitochondrial n=1 Tax=Talaromyces proteolyticus TaxID=1131652 RepID=A0AAD4KYZ8_9EURO|nr:mitochondrial matrix Mmp37 [Talaromyces proteolyticus]KAH8699111.1 mitochondrial matrix Mmp37 [Talaromyces proteolyticus]